MSSKALNSRFELVEGTFGVKDDDDEEGGEEAEDDEVDVSPAPAMLCTTLAVPGGSSSCDSSVASACA